MSTPEHEGTTVKPTAGLGWAIYPEGKAGRLERDYGDLELGQSKGFELRSRANENKQP